MFLEVELNDAPQTLVNVTRYSSFLKLKVTDNRLALSSLRRRRAGIKHFQSKLSYNSTQKQLGLLRKVLFIVSSC